MKIVFKKSNDNIYYTIHNFPMRTFGTDENNDIIIYKENTHVYYFDIYVKTLNHAEPKCFTGKYRVLLETETIILSN